MGCPSCDPLCGCLPLTFALRGLALIKIVVLVNSMAIPVVAVNPSYGGSQFFSRLRASGIAAAYCYLVILLELIHSVLCIVLLAIVESPPYKRLLIPTGIIGVLHVIYFVALVVMCAFVREANFLLIAHFAVSAILMLFMALVVWGLLRRDKKAGTQMAGNPQVPFNAVSSNGYGAPVYGQPSQVQSYVVVVPFEGVAPPPGQQETQQVEGVERGGVKGQP